MAGASSSQHEACNHGHGAVVSALLDLGALVNVPGFDNDTPLHDAVANGHAHIARMLLERGANPDLRWAWHTVQEWAWQLLGCVSIVR